MWKTQKERVKDVFKAGNDILLFPEIEDFETIEEAIKSGEISEERIDESVRRILEMKAKIGLFDDVEDTYKDTGKIMEEESESHFRSFFHCKYHFGTSFVKELFFKQFCCSNNFVFHLLVSGNSFDKLKNLRNILGASFSNLHNLFKIFQQGDIFAKIAIISY